MVFSWFGTFIHLSHLKLCQGSLNYKEIIFEKLKKAAALKWIPTSRRQIAQFQYFVIFYTLSLTTRIVFKVWCLNLQIYKGTLCPFLFYLCLFCFNLLIADTARLCDGGLC